jgi:hypothetical protein
MPNSASVTAATSQGGQLHSGAADNRGQLAADITRGDAVGQPGRHPGDRHRDRRSCHCNRQAACQPATSPKTPFAHAKHNLGLRRFTSRGIDRATAESNFHALVHDLFKAIGTGTRTQLSGLACPSSRLHHRRRTFTYEINFETARRADLRIACAD